MDAKTVCDENQLRNVAEEREAFARGWRLWCHGAVVGDCVGAVEVVGWKFAAYTSGLFEGNRARMVDAYGAAVDFLRYAPGCDSCGGERSMMRDTTRIPCPVCTAPTKASQRPTLILV